jgi:hypothetical protein
VSEDESRGPAPDMLLYDLSKYLLTLCLLILGGLLTLTETANSPLPPRALAVILGSLVISSTLSLTCIGRIVSARHTGKPATSARRLNGWATLFLGGGVGAFLMVWISQLF